MRKLKQTWPGFNVARWMLVRAGTLTTLPRLLRGAMQADGYGVQTYPKLKFFKDFNYIVGHEVILKDAAAGSQVRHGDAKSEDIADWVIQTMLQEAGSVPVDRERPRGRRNFQLAH